MFRFKYLVPAIALTALFAGLWLSEAPLSLLDRSLSSSPLGSSLDRSKGELPVRTKLRSEDGGGGLQSATQTDVEDPWEGATELFARELDLEDSDGQTRLQRVVKSEHSQTPIAVVETLSRDEGGEIVHRETLSERSAYRFLLQPQAGIDERRFRMKAAALELDLIERLSKTGPYLARLNYEANDPEALEGIVLELNQGGHGDWVAHASFDFLRRAARSPNDARYLAGEQWGLANDGSRPGAVAGVDIDAEKGWDQRVDASSIIVAVVDTGIRYTHEDLADNMWVNDGEIPGNGLDDDGNGFVDDRHGINVLFSPKFKEGGDPMDDNGHGTHVAGIVGAVGNNGKGIAGVAWKTQLMGLKFLGVDGSGLDSNAIKCIDYAIEHGADIINCSWGGSGINRAVEDAVRRARDAGVIVVAAAGNGSSDIDKDAYTPAGIDLPNVVTVGNHDAKDDYHLSSNFGSYSVDIAAPGSRILSTFHLSDSSYRVRSGTSMAAPHVAGMLALIRASRSDESIYRSIERLLQGARQGKAYERKTRSGARANLAEALAIEEVGPASPTEIEVFALSEGAVLNWKHGWDVPIDGFRIERKIGAGDWEQIGIRASDMANYVDSNPSPLSSREYRVFAFRSGIASLPSQTVELNRALRQTSRSDIALPSNKKGSGFGDSLAIDGNTLAVAAPFDDDAGDEAGSVYLYERMDGSSWQFRQKAIGSDSGPYEFFGSSLSIGDGVLVAGAPGSDVQGIDAGAAYVFERNTLGRWEETARLLGADVQGHDRFGYSVSVNADRIAVSARDDDSMGVNAGAVYVFERNGAGGWRQASKVLPPDREDRQYFGWSVSLRGDRLAVGAKGDGQNGPGAGAVYLYERDGNEWRLESKIAPESLSNYDGFGYSVVLEEASLLIGAPGQNGVELDEGSVYLYREIGDDWEMERRIRSSAPESGLRFGTRIALRENRIAVASEDGDTTVRLFERNAAGDWEEGSSAFGKKRDGLDGRSVALGERVLSVGNAESLEIQSLFETPDRPVSLRLESDFRGVTLSWMQLRPAENAFAVERRMAGEENWDFLGVTGKGEMRFVDRSAFGGRTWEYRVTAIGGALSQASSIASVPILGSSRLINLSARGYQGSGERKLIPGFSIVGKDDLSLLIRARGPSLLDAGLREAVLDPSLSVRDSAGREIGANGDWYAAYSLDRMEEVEAVSGASPIGLFASEAAVIDSFGEGVRTVVVSAASDAGGLALAEVFELETDASSESRLANLSARGFVDRGDRVLIGGFALDGEAPMRLLIRGVGPGLESRGVASALPDPVISLYDAEGKMIESNDDWSRGAEGTTIASLASDVGAFALKDDSKDAALIAILPPGLYTAVLRSKDDDSGVGLLELYAAP